MFNSVEACIKLLISLSQKGVCEGKHDAQVEEKGVSKFDVLGKT